MVKPDIIISWPNNCDYPLWREFLTVNRHRFNEVIIAITETNQEPNYTAFIKESLTPLHCQFVIPPPTPPTDDWRNIAVNQCLIHSYNAEWIWFTEQDYIIEDVEKYFFEVNVAEQQGHEIMAHYESDRMHPCSIFIKRTLLNKTRKQFGIIPNKGDHFLKFQQDIEALQSPVYKLTHYTKHLNGLSSNMSLIARGEAPNYKPDELAHWIYACLKANVIKDKTWVEIYKKWLTAYLPQIDL